MQLRETKIGELQRQRDMKLVRSLLAGDQRAFQAFVDEYLPRLYRYARRRIPGDAALDDVVQNTLSQAARSLHSFRGEASLATWLVSILRHEISRELRRTELDRERMMPFLNDELLRASVERIENLPADQPDAACLREEIRTRIGLALDQLPESQALALEWKYIAGCSSREIAGRFGISDLAVQSLLARARRGFRALYGTAMGDESPQQFLHARPSAQGHSNE